MQWLALMAVLVLPILGFLLYRLTRRPAPPPRMMRPHRAARAPIDRHATAPLAPSRPPAATTVQQDDYGILLALVLGDRQKAERLIAYEQRHEPDAPRTS